ncbi:hypothetical protein HYC85_030399 [Camellia sinensis]|uniref:Aminotransferase-like plant mobile domain-containing protein n=1 Tax=Camellia sinensis TaxID=4442 RepID=A0A7J7G3Q0_CAMSI|nr:hypothetical protein HYC85_030399 [Camellia sinensis]
MFNVISNADNRGVDGKVHRNARRNACDNAGLSTEARISVNQDVCLSQNNEQGNARFGEDDSIAASGSPPGEIWALYAFSNVPRKLFSQNLSVLSTLNRFLKMTGHFPHGGGSLGAGGEPDIMSLHPRVRPFIPERYDPLAHILPRAIFYHFTDFDERAPGDLLLRKPEYHLSHEAREVTSRTVRGYGSTAARDWYAELSEAVRDLVDLVGFGPFCTGLSRCPARRTLMAALVERWWDTTNSFHFSATGDLTMTPFDFAVLTGLDVGGWPILYDEDMDQWEAAWIYFLGACPPVDRSSGRVRYTWFSFHFRRVEMEPGTPEEVAQYARDFLMFLFGTTLFADRGNTVGLYLLSALVDLSQLWVYVYFPTLAPELVVEGPLVTPYSLVFEGQHRPRPRESLLYLRQYFDTVRSTEDPPSAPPVDMRIADRLSSRDVVSAMLGTDALLHLEEGDYATYRHIYLMPPLTGVRTLMIRPAGMPSSSQAWARAADAPSTSRAGTSRGGGGLVPPIPPTYPHPGWPDMPTELMGWQYGTTSPIPIQIEPPMPGHRYVRDPDLPPPPVEYMDQVLEMVASLEGMVLRREAQLSIMGFQVPFSFLMPPVYASPQAGPPGPSRAGGPSGGSSRRRRAHIIEEEPGEDEEEEAADRQSETSADREDGSALGSGSGGEAEGDPEDDDSDSDDGDGDGGGESIPQKRTKRASYSCS